MSAFRNLVSKLPLLIVAMLLWLAWDASAAIKITDGLNCSGGVRAYFENAYLSSGGSWKYDRPVAEQYFDLTLDAGKYGWILTDGWIFSDIGGACQEKHRRLFSCYEGTLVYGYDLPLDEARNFHLRTSAGMLWDWLGGYKTYAGTPIYFYCYQSMENPWLTPYWRALAGPISGGTASTYVKLGLRHNFIFWQQLHVQPFVETTWGDANRFKANYGEALENPMLGGSFMYCYLGTVVKWYLSPTWYVWGRYRQLFMLDAQVRRIIRDRTSGPHDTEYPFFGLGIGLRF